MNAIEICVTSACNLKCLHCYQHDDKNKHEIPIEKLTEIIDFVNNEKCEKIVFSGGEFFMHPNALKILDYALNNTIADVTIQNNGTMIEPQRIISEFSKYKNRLTLSFSIDGLKEEHDKRRGKGTFDKIISNNSLLKDAGFRINAIITIDSHNHLYLPDLIDFVANNFNSMALLCIGKTGIACENEQYLGLNDKDLNETIRFVYTNLTEQKKSVRCNIFPSGLSIRYDGTVFPCAVARDMDIFPMGNITTNSIQSIIRNFYDTAEYQEIIQFENRKLIPECIECKKFDICLQGCRIRAKKAFNKLMKPDPFACFVYNNEYNEKSASDIFWGNV